jgi:hypothetical protein
MSGNGHPESRPLLVADGGDDAGGVWHVEGLTALGPLSVAEAV